MTLSEYVSALIARMGEADPEALARMQRAVGRRRARITLDDEAVDVAFEPRGLDVQPATSATRIDGDGGSDRRTVLALLDGHIEVTEAIMQGRLRVTGAAADVSRMFLAIEILLDVAARSPALQALADTLRAEMRAAPTVTAAAPTPPPRREAEMLARLGLLAEDGGR